MATSRTPDFARKRPAPRQAGGWGKSVSDNVEWTRIVEPRERYRVVYIDRDSERSERIIDLMKVGTMDGTAYLGVMQAGRFKTLRTDRVIEVLEQISTGHEPSIRSQPTYSTVLPPFPVKGALYKVPTVAVSKRTWTVDLNAYVCSCPERRIREATGYKPGQLGSVCPHMARAILDYLPAESGWAPELLNFLRNPRRIHVDNLV